MPCPVSATVSRPGSTATVTCPPGGVSRRAFSTRFDATCNRRSWSADTQVSRPVSSRPTSKARAAAKELVAQLYKEHSGKSDPLQYPASKKRLPNYFYKPLLDL